jgi:hypothetical protein
MADRLVKNRIDTYVRAREPTIEHLLTYYPRRYYYRNDQTVARNNKITVICSRRTCAVQSGRRRLFSVSYESLELYCRVACIPHSFESTRRKHDYMAGYNSRQHGLLLGSISEEKKTLYGVGYESHTSSQQYYNVITVL